MTTEPLVADILDALARAAKSWQDESDLAGPWGPEGLAWMYSAAELQSIIRMTASFDGDRRLDYLLRAVPARLQAWDTERPAIARDLRSRIDLDSYTKGQTDLYRAFDQNGTLLYVGISLDTLRRLTQHRTSSAWFSDYRRLTRETFATREIALAKEAEAIRTERPVWNVIHNRSVLT